MFNNAVAFLLSNIMRILARHPVLSWPIVYICTATSLFTTVIHDHLSLTITMRILYNIIVNTCIWLDNMTMVKFELNKSGIRQILQKQAEIRPVIQKALTATLQEIEAQFYIQFGVAGHFQYKDHDGKDRQGGEIEPADARTMSIIKQHPEWLDRFKDSISVE